MKIDVMGVRFDNLTMEESLDKAERLIAEGETFYCVTPNSEIVYEAMHNAELMQLLNDAALVLPDGAGVVLASKILKIIQKKQLVQNIKNTRKIKMEAATG